MKYGYIMIYFGYIKGRDGMIFPNLFTHLQMALQQHGHGARRRCHLGPSIEARTNVESGWISTKSSMLWSKKHTSTVESSGQIVPPSGWICHWHSGQAPR